MQSILFNISNEIFIIYNENNSLEKKEYDNEIQLNI
jgi:hypothetical protein